jgi:cytochrome c oxidase cbb3-type subunit III
LRARAFAFAAAVALASVLIDAQGAVTATTPRRGGNPAAAKLTNPSPGGADAIARGRQTYQRLCTRCHGPEGKGDGGGAGAGGQPADLTDATWDFGGSDGEVFSAIKEGTSADMESYSERISDTEIWNLVAFIRSIGPENARN